MSAKDSNSKTKLRRSYRLDDTHCSGSSDLTEKRRKQKIQKNSPLQDKGLLSVIFANEAKRKQKPIYQKTEML
jgi:hypothetical protein